MISFERESDIVNIKVKLGLTNSHFALKIEQSHEYQAILLREHLQKELNNHLKKIQEEYYNLGWRHKQKRLNKKTEFYGGW